MEKNVFVQNNRIVFTHLKIHWKLVLFFAICWFLFTVSLMVPTVFPFTEFGYNRPFIQVLHILSETQHENGSSGSGSSPMTISQVLNSSLFGPPAIIFFTVVIMTFAHLSFTKEIGHNQIGVWMTLSLSRTQIFVSKLLFILFTCFAIFMPSFLVIIIISATAYDANQFMGLVLLYGLIFFIFILALVGIYTLFFIIFSDKPALALIIISMISVYIIVTSVINLFASVAYEPAKWMLNFKYFSIQSLIVSPLNFQYVENNQTVVENIISENTTVTLTFNNLVKANLGWQIASPIVLLSLGCGSSYLGNHIFNRKNFNL
ncbi:hypothetical protein SSABA_v1c09130 [Spiroplasma sabaudiense Ar-1343]|uniref:Uncharacterized protein n=1 Tax=Spiroplasma sabaudiense Ar-1343 TaxID=1276257 RepID=W6AB83_9MOLU|nr:ABC transporter permease [Spiroplasma sabaudiense]AHI54312.1 hypothetical protein SSABA_v1c09130 [Spiroplasma sabaudiense Ar-1343]